MSLRDQILEQVHTLPALPTTVTAVIHLLDQTDVDTAEVTRTIELDPGLTSNILHIANSAYFGGPRQIGSVREAFVRLGTKRTLQVIMSSVVAPMAKPAVAGYDLPPGDLLRHAVATAIASEELAKALSLPVPDNVFTAGLLHDIGKIILGTFVQADATTVMALAFREKVSFEEAESRILGISHAEVGAELLQSWDLPQGIVDAVRWHHAPEACPRPSQMVDLIHVANLLVLMGGIGTGADGLNYHSSMETATRLSLTPQVSEAVLEKALNALLDIERLFASPEAGR